MFCAAALAVLAIGFAIGRYGPASTLGSGVTAHDPDDVREVLYWVAPMDPTYRRDEPGRSPMGMDLVPVYADAAGSEPGHVKIDPTMVQNLGVRTALAARSELPRTFETVGYVAYDEDTVQHVHTRVDGWIERLAAKASGERVTKGQLLFEIYSPTLVSGQEEYIAALRSENRSLTAASRDRLIALGVALADIEQLATDRQARRTVPVRAESDGVIAHLGVREGIFVTESTEIMSVARLDSVWLFADVFERQASWVQSGQQATVRLDSRPGEVLNSTIDYVYPELDPVTRTLRVRLRFDNESELLRPNMFARVTIDGSGFGEVVHVPREAVIRGGRVNRVVVDLGGGHFRVKPVTVGMESGDRVAIRSGLEAGERVVVSGQFLLDSESNIEAALGRLESRP
jgi:Cu(I)/Ag(I) efflux system membrane fusion protein